MSYLPKISHRAEKIAKGFDQPTEHLQSEGDILIKNLVQKQTNTKTSLNEQLSKKKEYVSSQDLVQITEFKVGETSLDAFKQTSERLNQIEFLKGCGLKSDEVDFYFDIQKGDHFLKTKYKNLSKDILDSRIKNIKDKIDSKKVENNEIDLSNQNISRHQKELASSIKPDSQETKLFNFAIANLGPKEDNTPLEHPINSLKALEKELFSHLDRKDRPSFTKRRKIMKKLEQVPSSCSSIPESNLKPKSKWDIKDSDLSSEIEMRRSSHAENFILDPNLKNCTEKKIYTCQTPTYYTVKDGRIVKLDKNGLRKEKEDLSEESLEKKPLEPKRLSDNEIRQISKFRNYDRGTPSKVLYVKNIPKNGKDEFLDLFKGDEQHEIKIMTGKMQGQAFITFKNVHLATDALNRYNGYYIKEKPVIISYGKSTT